MVKQCQETYRQENEETYKKYFDMFPYPLSPFQKHSIQGLIEGHHILVTAHTGSGKSTPFEFAAEYFINKGKKVIYCSPIKALSNQKFYDFTQKYPHISVGIVTGDIRVNQEASLLIVTTEILHNTLFLKKHKNLHNTQMQINNSSLLSFDMDFDNELACVVFDEFHYINDHDRGMIWENSVMMLPEHIQMLMLSATLDAPNKVANWIENRYPSSSEKQVWIASTNFREVPLLHYSFITTNQGIFKAVKKDEALVKEIKDATNCLQLIQNEKGEFNEPNYHKVKKMLNLFEVNQVYVKRTHVINQLCKHLFEQGLLPAICFVLSRKQLEICAKEVTVPVLEDDSKVPYIARREAEQILRKLPNFQEYLELLEFNNLVSLLEKGIGIHHAGMISILREIVELFLSKGYIKLLFCTETFAIGINFPIKTVIFTDVNKFDGRSSRTLYSHEYTQMAGRSGRRGHDKFGTVIHLNNIFRNIELTEYKTMMKGIPQTLVSKFKISYNLLLNLVDIGDNNYLQFCKGSMIQNDIDNQMGSIQDEMDIIKKDIDKMEISMKYSRTPKQIIDQYLVAMEKRKISVNKKRKELDREIDGLKDNYKFIEQDKELIVKYNDKNKLLENMNKTHYNTEQYLNENVNIILEYLEKKGFVQRENACTTLTSLGYIATHIREVHCLAFSRIIFEGQLNDLSAAQIVAVFSCFTNVTVSEDIKTINPTSSSSLVKGVIMQISQLYDQYQDFETESRVNTGVDYNIHFELIDSVIKWCNCNSVEECKVILQDLEINKNIFLGEFVKAILKINNISSEMEKIAESIGNIELLSKLREIPILTLKFVATNQSLYI